MKSETLSYWLLQTIAILSLTVAVLGEAGQGTDRSDGNIASFSKSQ